MDGWAEVAKLDRVLGHCDTITSLRCGSETWLHFWPPNLTAVVLARQALEYAAAAEVQHMQLLRMQDAAKLQQLSLATGPVCQWPAALAGSLPGRLRKVHVSLYITDEDAESNVDLSAFSRAAGCTAELDISLLGACSPGALCLAGVIASLRDVGSFHLLRLDWPAGQVAWYLQQLSQLQCSRCVLAFPSLDHLAFPCLDHVAQLPTFGHLTLVVEELLEKSVEPLTCEWAALASPGVRCLGSADQPLLDVEVRGCPGVPVQGAPWALAGWADMRTVWGLPVASFLEEAPGMHVWRNAAGADLVVGPPLKAVDWYEMGC